MTETDRALLRYAIPTNEMLSLEILHLREVLALKETALELQAKEYDRRLSSLNHEAEQLKAMQSTYLPREMYESRHRELDAKIDNRNGMLSERLSLVERNVWLATGGITVLFSGLQLLLHFMK